ncbi:flagellar hook-length control protein FliK [Tepidamorphus sp. 3E244]|uniref:flagellar hook-length control protein FliK n=1 Tax=Tepidamorphus sp. 3E244 TaxID=3385498 RepID=UPI0038FD2CE5
MAIGGIPAGGGGNATPANAATATLLGELKSGDVLTARVQQGLANGVRLAVGRAVLDVVTTLALKPGTTVNLQVQRQGAEVQLRLLDQPPQQAGRAQGQPTAQPQTTSQPTAQPAATQTGQPPASGTTQASTTQTPAPQQPPPSAAAPRGAEPPATPAQSTAQPGTQQQPPAQTQAVRVTLSADAPRPASPVAQAPAAPQAPAQPAQAAQPAPASVSTQPPTPGSAATGPTGAAPQGAPTTTGQPAQGSTAQVAQPTGQPASPPAGTATAGNLPQTGTGAPASGNSGTASQGPATAPASTTTQATTPGGAAPTGAARASAAPTGQQPTPSTAVQTGAPAQAASTAQAPSLPTTIQAVATARAQALSTQSGFAPLFANLQAAVSASGQSKLDPGVEAAARQLLGLRVNSDALGDGQQLRAGLQRSGNFLESSLARQLPSGGDLKAALLGLKSVLSSLLGDEARTSGEPGAGKAPDRGSNPQAERPATATLRPNVPIPEMMRQLLGETDGALNRMRLLQIASLPDGDGQPRTDAQEPGGRVWQMALPIADAGRTAIAGIRIAEERRQNDKDEDRRAWRVRLSLDLDGAGAIAASIVYAPPNVSVALWAEEDETLALLKRNAGLLSDALTAAELDVDSIDIEAGRPPDIPRAKKQAVAGSFYNREG